MIGPIHFTRGSQGFQLVISWIEDGARQDIFFFTA